MSEARIIWSVFYDVVVNMRWHVNAVEILFEKLYEKFLQEINAIHNGIDVGENMK